MGTGRSFSTDAPGRLDRTNDRAKSRAWERATSVGSSSSSVPLRRRAGGPRRPDDRRSWLPTSAFPRAGSSRTSSRRRRSRSRRCAMRPSCSWTASCVRRSQGSAGERRLRALFERWLGLGGGRRPQGRLPLRRGRHGARRSRRAGAGRARAPAARLARADRQRRAHRDRRGRLQARAGRRAGRLRAVRRDARLPPRAAPAPGSPRAPGAREAFDALVEAARSPRPSRAARARAS